MPRPPSRRSINREPDRNRHAHQPGDPGAGHPRRRAGASARRGAGRGRAEGAGGDAAHPRRARCNPRDAAGARRDRRGGHGRVDRTGRAGEGRWRRVHRLARPVDQDRRGDHGSRHPVAAGHRDRGRHHARARHGAGAFQVLPGRDQRRGEGAQGARRALLPVQILPDRRDHRSERARLAGDRAGAVRRRQLGDRGHVARDRSPRPRGGWPRPVTSRRPGLDPGPRFFMSTEWFKKAEPRVKSGLTALYEPECPSLPFVLS
ncbi:hypothetical protein SPHINGO8AM_90009 [Sphingomonas sp. 8AM]|nr:hypothetical protein SPHINGO8AM_90009 [Sphingomonas sp. 8AM]